MAMVDYGVITVKNNELLEETDSNGWIVSNGAVGEFKHAPSGVVFYRTSIKDHENVDKAKVRIDLYSELGDKRKKVLHTTINGLTLKTKEIYPHTYKTHFTDDNGDSYVVIHGYDVSFGDYWDNKRGKVINAHLVKHTK